MRPQVSIAIPTYNRAGYLVEALESALSQTYPAIELIVVNDGSTDETEKVLQPYMKRIRYIRQENRGWAEAKNRGLEASTGEFLCILDDDDRLHPMKVTKQLEMFQKNPDLGICATGFNIIDEGGKVIEGFIPPPIRPQTQALEMLRMSLVNQSSAMLHRRCYAKLGGLKQIHSDDYEYWLRASVHFRIGVVPEKLTDYRRHPRQLTRLYGAEVDRMACIVIKEFIEKTPMGKIIPGLKSETAGRGVLGMILCERNWLSQAQHHLEKLLPDAIGHFCLGILNIYKRDFAQAKIHFEQARNSHLAVDRALALTAWAQAIVQTPGMHNNHPEALAFRRDMSDLRTSTIRYLFALARGKPGNGSPSASLPFSTDAPHGK